jgi:hemoglobin
MDDGLNERRSPVYDAAGGNDAFFALAVALNKRCLEDPVLNHPFSHGTHPQHLDRLASYLAEVFGGPPTYSQLWGNHSGMLLVHAGNDAQDDLGERFIRCFDVAVADAHFPADLELRRVLHDYVTWAVSEVHSYAPRGSVVAADMALPRWSWDGLET